MLNFGRPVSLNRKNVSEACMHIYWKHGINNISYNDVIKSSKLSKGSFYKLFENEDDLQAETIDIYDNNVNVLSDKLRNAEDLFQMMLLLKELRFENNLKYCYFFVSYLEKYRMGKKTKNKINKIEFKYKLLLNKISKKHIEKFHINKSKISSKKIANFIFNSIALISLLYRNKSTDTNIKFYINSLYDFIENINNFKK